MKYHLDTIPVWDAYHEDSECPFCILEYKAEQSYVSFFLGGSVMEPDTRIQVNDKGFCTRHNILLYQAQNRLGLALITQGYCLSHFPLVLDMAAERLSDARLAAVLKEMLPVQEKSMHRLEKELDWFTKKFDYQNQDKPWSNSRDALPRMLQKLTGKIME